MDRLDFPKKLKQMFDKYKLFLLILGIGIFLMLLPDQNRAVSEERISVPQETTAGLTEELEDILGHIDGVGKIEVLLTESDGPHTIYQTDEDRNISTDSETVRTQTVVVTNSGREESGLIRSVTPPVYLGAIVVCQGGDIPTVKLSVVQAVSTATGIPSDRITVLKMK